MLDPNSTIPTAFEVRVTMRGVRLTPDGSPVQVSTRSDFVAPELSAPSLLAQELDKGLRGWTRDDVELSDKRPQHLIRAERARKAQAKADLDEITVGTAIVRTTVRREVARKRPTTRRWV